MPNFNASQTPAVINDLLALLADPKLIVKDVVRALESYGFDRYSAGAVFHACEARTNDPPIIVAGAKRKAASREVRNAIEVLIERIKTGETERDRIVRRLRALAATPKITRETVFNELNELGFEWGGPAVDVIKHVEAGAGDATRVAIRLLARAVEAGEAHPAAIEPAEEPEPTEELEEPEEPIIERDDRMLAPLRVLPVDELLPDELDERAALPPLEELEGAELLRALADDLASSKVPLHRAAVAQLYDIAARLDDGEGSRQLPKTMTEDLYDETVQQLAEHEHKLKRYGARIAAIEATAHEPFDFTSFVKRLENVGDRLAEVETDMKLWADRAFDSTGFVKRLENVERQLVDRYAEVVDKNVSLEKRLEAIEAIPGMKEALEEDAEPVCSRCGETPCVCSPGSFPGVAPS